MFPKAAPVSHYPWMGVCKVTAMAACFFWAVLWTSLLGNSGLVKLNHAAAQVASQFFRGISQAWHYSCPSSRDRTFVPWNRSNQRNSAAEPGRTAWTPSWASAPASPPRLICPCPGLSRSKLPKSWSLPRSPCPLAQRSQQRWGSGPLCQREGMSAATCHQCAGLALSSVFCQGFCSSINVHLCSLFVGFG